MRVHEVRLDIDFVAVCYKCTCRARIYLHQNDSAVVDVSVKYILCDVILTCNAAPMLPHNISTESGQGGSLVSEWMLY